MIYLLETKWCKMKDRLNYSIMVSKEKRNFPKGHDAFLKTPMRFTSIDIFCHVIDNYGDAGVVYRFAKECLLARPGLRIRVFIDDVKPLHDMVPGIDPVKTMQELDGVAFNSWDIITEDLVKEIGTADILVEAFACFIPDMVLETASRRPTVIINLEYFSAEPWIEGYHLKESLVGRGALKKYYFMPGLTPASGGVIIDTRMERARGVVNQNRVEYFAELLEKYGLGRHGSKIPLFGTVFTYTRGFDTLLEDLQSIDNDVFLFVLGQKSAEGMLRTLERKTAGPFSGPIGKLGNTHIVFMPFLPQYHYDELLCACDFNIVRGEDSLVRAVLAGKPLLWQAYIQENKYQLVKVKAFAETFRRYCDDENLGAHFHDTLMEFNAMGKEEPAQKTQERYVRFFSDLNKIECATRKMSYFMRENCNLVKKFLEFLDQI